MASNHPVNTSSTTPPPIDLDIGLPVFDPRTASASNCALAANVDPVVTESVILLDPHSIQVPSTPNRTESSFESEQFEELRQGIAAKGTNLQPIRVRWIPELNGVPGHWELVWGERRLRACREAGLRVSAIVAKDDSSADDYLDRIRENRGRADLTPWEFSQQVRHALERPPGMRKIELASRIGCNVSTISRANDMAHLPVAVVDAFQSPNDIRYEDVKPLRDAYERNPTAVQDEAGRIRAETEPPAAAQVVKRLVLASQGLFASCKQPPAAGQTTVLEGGGKAVGFWRLSPKGAIEVHIETAMSDNQRDAMLEQMTSFLARKVLKKAVPKPASAAAEAISREEPKA